jgi:hypothetical protein
MKSIYSRRKNYSMPEYLANKKEKMAYEYCVRNNIRISPIGMKEDNQAWKIEIRLGPYKKGERPNVSPSIYDKYTIWPEYYRMCRYYYDKYKK